MSGPCLSLRPQPAPEALDLAGAGKAAFKPLGTIKNAKGHVTATLAKAKGGTTHEWYAAVGDCGHKARIAARRFTVASP